MTQNVHKTFKVGEIAVRVLYGVTINVARGELLGIIGPSGSS